jgi:hypothetical protein
VVAKNVKPASIFGNKKREYQKHNNKLAMNSKKKNIRNP